MGKLSEKLQLLRGVVFGNRSYSSPFFVSIDITRRCNLQCLCCRCHSPIAQVPSSGNHEIQDISVDLVNKFCDELKSTPPGNVIFEGEGEPFLHPHLFQLISSVKNAGYELMLFTNGTLLNEKNSSFLVDSAVDTLKVSMWSGTSEGYQATHPGADPQNFDNIVQNLQQLSAIKKRRNAQYPLLVLCYPIIRSNLNDMTSIIDLARTSDCDGVHFSKLDTVLGNFDNFAITSAEENRLKTSLASIAKELDRIKVGHNIKFVLKLYDIEKAARNYPPCYAPWFYARLKVDGTLLACNLSDWSMGNLAKDSFPAIWNGEEYRRFRKMCTSGRKMMIKGKFCTFGSCTHMGNNMHIHSYLRWMSPFIRRKSATSSIAI